IQGTISGAAGTNVALTATASLPTGFIDPTPADQTDSVTTSITATSDISVNASGPASAAVGSTATYTIVVTNNGPQDSTVGVSIPVPAGLSGVTFIGPTSGSGAVNDSQNLASGASIIYTIQGTVSSTANVTLTATASLPTGFIDPTPA